MLDNNGDLARARSRYAYPPFCLTRGDPAKAFLWGLPVAIAGPLGEGAQLADYSSFGLDQYHNRLLRSEDDESVLLGVASVTFWGFALGRGGRFTTERALSRAKIVAGLGRPDADEEDTIVETVRKLANLLDRVERQAAIKKAMTLRNHGLAFASKLLAFLSPETECVYDEVISLQLQASDDPRLNTLYVPTRGSYRIAEKAAAYEGWAKLCLAKAKELNEVRIEWKDWDGTNRPWRAVDVERAFFSLGRD